MQTLSRIPVAILLLVFSSSGWARPLPNTITDQEFWKLVTGLSEVGGRFQQQFMSNEDSYQHVMPQLRTLRKDGIYIGVGSEQNFTYIAATQPKLSFVIDIRRDNMLEHLMYKAMFELSRDRADFLSLLFSRKRPANLSSNASSNAIFDAFAPVDPDADLYQRNLAAVLDRLVSVHRFDLSDADKESLARVMTAFRTAGPYSLKGTGDRTNPPYAQLMSMTDPTGANSSYLASEESFKVVQKLQNENRIIPLVGDFAGDKTIVQIGKYLKEHDAIVNVFYVSNVERYLFDDFGRGKQFYVNLASLPLDSSSAFVRSVTTDISIRLGFPLPAGKEKWRTFVFSIKDCLQRLSDGRIKGYQDLFEGIK